MDFTNSKRQSKHAQFKYYTPAELSDDSYYANQGLSKNVSYFWKTMAIKFLSILIELKIALNGDQEIMFLQVWTLLLKEPHLLNVQIYRNLLMKV